jgi:hypothetical protein
MKWQQLILAFIATISLIFAGNALAQTDININNTNLIRFGGSVTVPENQVVENALAFGGNVTVSPNARVLDTAIAFGGDVILKKGVVDLSQVYMRGFIPGGQIAQVRVGQLANVYLDNDPKHQKSFKATVTL